MNRSAKKKNWNQSENNKNCVFLVWYFSSPPRHFVLKKICRVKLETLQKDWNVMEKNRSYHRFLNLKTKWHVYYLKKKFNIKIGKINLYFVVIGGGVWLKNRNKIGLSIQSLRNWFHSSGSNHSLDSRGKESAVLWREICCFLGFPSTPRPIKKEFIWLQFFILYILTINGRNLLNVKKKNKFGLTCGIVFPKDWKTSKRSLLEF